LDAILIAGPTASGKSALAVRLATAVGGAVINADSMQVYSDLRILTARPWGEELAAAPHHLFGHVDAATDYSVGRWLMDVAGELERIRADGRLPIIVGGTGLYFKALLEGLSEIPPTPAAIRARLRAEFAELPTDAIAQRLARVDPLAAARLRPSDRQRLLRALEVVEATGQSIVAFQSVRSRPLLSTERTIAAFLAPERSVVSARIDSRFLAMLSEGALDEVARLARRGLDPSLPAMRAHGVPHLMAHCRGALSLAEATARGQADTRAYAKRQMTWFRHQLAGFDWMAPEAAEDRILGRTYLAVRTNSS
jgi:tRNA dimethylallyltransferase